jgi:hypothetical protein
MFVARATVVMDNICLRHFVSAALSLMVDECYTGLHYYPLLFLPYAYYFSSISCINNRRVIAGDYY